MKKIVLLTTVVVFFAGITSYAQVKFGIKGGANFYQIGGSDASDYGLNEKRKTKIGICGGGIVNIPVSDMISVQPEVLFSQEGNLQKDGDAKMQVNLNYINVPILLQYNNPSGFFAETGPQVGFLMSAKTKIDDGTGEMEEDIKDDLKGIGFSWSLGAGYKLKSGFGFGARYNLGLSTIDDSEDNAKLTSSGFHIGVFFMFGGGGEKK